MAKKSGGGSGGGSGKASTPLRMALRIDLDGFSTDLAAAKKKADGSAVDIEGVMGKVADRVSARYLSVQAGIRLAERGVRDFIATANELEKNGQGNEGTAALARLETSLGRLWESFVKTTLQTELARGALKAFADIADYLTEKMSGTGQFADFMTGWGLGAIGKIEEVLASAEDKIGAFLEEIGNKLRGAEWYDAATGTWRAAAEFPGFLGLEPDIQVREMGLDPDTGRTLMNAGAGMMTQSDALRDAGKKNLAAAWRIQQAALAKDLGGEDETYTDPAPSFLDKVSGVTDRFRASWTGAFESISRDMAKFNKDTQQNAFGLSAALGGAFSDAFDSIAFAGQVAQKVFANSATAAKIFQVADLTRLGVTAGVEALKMAGDGYNLAGDGNPAAGVKFVAAGAYAAAAAVAGYGVSQQFAGTSAASAGFNNPSDDSSVVGQQRRSVFVSIGTVVGSEQFTREVLIPEINAGVGDDVFVRSTTSISSDRVDPGR